MNREEKIYLFSMLIKMSKDLKSIAMAHFTYGWDEHAVEREYFQRRLDKLRQLAAESDLDQEADDDQP